MAVDQCLSMKHKTSELYSLCASLFPDEFKRNFTAPRNEFRDWLNSKTGLSVDHITNRDEAMDAWIEKLKSMSKSGKKQ